MESFVNLLETLFIHVSVDLRGGDVGMAEHFLDDAKICTATEKMRGERVAQQVGMHVEAHGFGAGGNDLFEAFRRQFRAAHANKDVAAGLFADKFGTAGLKPAVESIAGSAPDGNDARLVSFTRDANEALLERELIDEEWAERVRDREFWLPLKKELEQLRRLRS